MKLYKQCTIILLLTIIISTTTCAEIVTHENKLPLPGNQFDQGSCTAWAVAYAKTYYEVKEWNIGGMHIMMSPSFIYNQLNDGQNKGITIPDALRLLNDVGCLPISEFEYDVFDYTRQPNRDQIERAGMFINRSYNAFGCTSDVDIIYIKNLLKDNVLVTSIPIYPDCRKLNWSNKIYSSMKGVSEGNHTVAVIGYNDNLKSFIFINSWGRDWGLNGYGYISYSLIKKIQSVFYQMVDYPCSPNTKLLSGLLKWQIKY